jgi:hypothetical protein
MYSVIRLLDVVPADRDRLLGELSAAAAEAGALRWVVRPSLAGSRNGGDIIAHLRFAAEDQWARAAGPFAALTSDPAVTRVNGAGYSGEPERCDARPGAVYRTLLLRVSPATAQDALVRFERELSSMPRYVRTIRAWQLSRVSEAIGTTAWTHVFEQEFSDVDGLMGPYLMHPIHWAVVDRWFDPECPEVIVRDRVCHSFCAITDPILG